MSGKPNFGDTLTNGIQDVSALLPLLGTEQCERHVGSALEKGFLYAAATPLSIFGSLGVVKTAFATLLATITFPFYGGKWLVDAGFDTPGSVSSMVTIAEGGMEYGAEVKLAKLLEDQHIDDLDLVEDVEWSGWRKGADSHSSWWMSLSWNTKLIITSALAALISVSPYLYLISFDWTDSLSWFFPLLRAFGSFLCVVAIQLALQLRIHHIIRGRLLLMKATKSSSEEHLRDADRRDTLEQGLRKLRVDPEKADASQNSITEDLSNVLTTDWVLIVYQLIMAIGIPMIIIGYVGCFNLVSQSIGVGGPYIWLGIEAVLSALRVALWGWNPEWDESTGMKIKLKLSDETPLVMTLYPLHRLKESRSQTRQKFSFIICNENDFLATAAKYTGPLQRFVSGTVSLFHSLVADKGCQSKHLLTTILDLHTRTTETFYIDSGGNPVVFSSTYKLDPRMNAMRVTLDDEIKWDESRQDNVFDQVLDHSKQIANRLCGNGRIDALDLRWTISYSSPKGDLSMSEIAMNDGDTAYISAGNLFIDKSSFCEHRVGWIGRYMYKWEATWSPNEWRELDRGIEALHILENFVLEMYLCSKVQMSARELSEPLGHRFSAEWVHEMECRMSEEKEECIKRLNEWRLHEDVKQHIIEQWERASEHLTELRFTNLTDMLAELMEILDQGDVMKFIFTLFDTSRDYHWPSSSPSAKRVRCALDSQVRWLVRRLKTVLQDGIPSSSFPRDALATTNFAEDLYLNVDDASAHVLDAIRLNSSLRAIDLADFLSASDIKNILEIVAEKDTLTTLISKNPALSTEILQNHHHIFFLPRMTCSKPCTKHPLCALVHRNRQEWRDRARSAGSDVTYTVGFTTPGTSYYPKNDEIGLYDDADCLIMVYTQFNEHLKLSLQHRRDWSDLSLHISLRSGEIASNWKEVHSIPTEDIPERYANRPHEVVIPEVSAGYHEIRIQIKLEGDILSSYYLHSAAVTCCESDTDSRPEEV